MIRTEEYHDALRVKETTRPSMILATDFLPFIYEFVPVITKTGRVMRGNLQVGDGYFEEVGELFWICQPMNYGPGESRMELEDILYWIG